MELLCMPGVDDGLGLPSQHALVGILVRRLHPAGLTELAADAHAAAASFGANLQRRQAKHEADRCAAEARERARVAAVRAMPPGAAAAVDASPLDHSDANPCAPPPAPPTPDKPPAPPSPMAVGGAELETITWHDALSDEECLLMLKLALLASCQLSIALLAQSLVGLLCARLRTAASSEPISPAEMQELSYAAAPDVTPIGCAAMLLRLSGPLRRCALEATDGTARALASRCSWAAQLALLAEPSTDLHLSLAIACIGAALNVTANQEDREEPIADLAERVRSAVLAATHPGRSLPRPRPRLGPSFAQGELASPVSPYKQAEASVPPRAPGWRQR